MFLIFIVSLILTNINLILVNRSLIHYPYTFEEIYDVIFFDLKEQNMKAL